MSAPSYSSKNYTAAADKYKALLEEYTGESGMRKASSLASNAAADASTSAGTSAYRQALAQGYSRAQAAQMGLAQGANNYNTSYSNAYNNASNMMGNKVNGYQSLLNGAQQQDVNEYNARNKKQAANMGIAMGVMQGISSALGGGSTPTGTGGTQ